MVEADTGRWPPLARGNFSEEGDVVMCYKEYSETPKPLKPLNPKGLKMGLFGSPSCAIPGLEMLAD